MHCLSGAMAGADDLAKGELKFYQGEIRSAESFIIRGLEHAREQKQFDITHRALFYILRIAIFQGNHAKAEQVMKDMETQMAENEYSTRYITYDVVLAWYYCILGFPDRAPDWLKDEFTPYRHAYFLENFGNQVKACYCYLTKNYPPLLAYIQELKQRESILYGHIEMLALEACVHYKLKDKEKAFEALAEAYKTASPNGITMPFIELGKEMRTLTSVALKEGSCTIPKTWLESINRKAASYAKRQAHVAAEYKQAKGISNGIAFSPREAEVLRDLSHGLSRTEIADSRGLSVNTVKMIINMIYTKAGAENLADLIRIAVEKKMI
jgi:LuxR family maltose regulon positive regulatory protein